MFTLFVFYMTDVMVYIYLSTLLHVYITICDVHYCMFISLFVISSFGCSLIYYILLLIIIISSFYANHTTQSYDLKIMFKFEQHSTKHYTWKNPILQERRCPIKQVKDMFDGHIRGTGIVADHPMTGVNKTCTANYSKLSQLP